MKKIITLVGDLLVDAGDLPLLLLVVLRLGQLHFPVQGDELTTGQFSLFSRQSLLQLAEVGSFWYTVPSDRMAKFFSPTSTPTDEPVLGSSLISCSASRDTKYLPEAVRRIVALMIRPSTFLELANRTHFSFGSLSRFPTIETSGSWDFPWIFVLYD